MNKDTGRLVNAEAFTQFMDALPRNERRRLGKQFMKVTPTPHQLARKPPKVGRNDPCPCGSGKKFKKCCWTGRHAM